MTIRIVSNAAAIAAGLVLLCTSSLAGGPGDFGPTQSKADSYARGIIVKYHDDAATRSGSVLPTAAIAANDQATLADAISRETGLAFAYHLPILGAHVYQLSDWHSEFELDAISVQLALDPAVEYAETDAMMRPMFTPNDPLYPSQWHYFEALGGLNLPTAWDTVTGAGTIVAVIDTGVRPHVDLVANLLPGYDMVSSTLHNTDGDGRDSDARDPGDWRVAFQCAPSGPSSGARDSSWHGTHVAGTAAARGDNLEGGIGVAFNAQILPIRALASCGGTISDIAAGITWASGGTVAGLPANPNQADVINMSLGGNSSCGSTYTTAINDARSRGTVVVASAGNSNNVNGGANFNAPANCTGVVTVAATNRAGARAFYSDTGTVVDIAAPGGETSTATNGVLSTLNTGTTVPMFSNYDWYQGTSMAAPHIAGLAALLLEGNPFMTPDQVEQLIENSARSFPGVCSDCGAGIGDATAAAAALPPLNDNFDHGFVLVEGSLTGDTIANAFVDGGTSGVGNGEPDVWYTYTATFAGTLRLNTCGTRDLPDTLDTVLSVHSDTGVTGDASNELALNDDWAGAGGDASANCPQPRDSALAVPLGAGQSVLVRVSRFSQDGEFILNTSFTITPPGNDDFGSAFFIGDGTASGTLAGATLDGSTSGAGSDQPDVWYRYAVPAGSGTLRINTCGSQALTGLDSVLSVHSDTGVAGTAANQLALNDDWQGSGGDPTANCPGIRDSSVALTVAGGEVLLIRVSRFSAFTNGDFSLTVSFEPDPPANDNFNNPISTGLAGSFQGTLFGGTKDGSSSVDNPSFPNEPDVWYEFTAPADGTVRINTCGTAALSGVFTTLSLHPSTGAVGTAANELAANDNWADPSGDPTANCPDVEDSSLAYLLAAGETVLVRVSREDDFGNEFLINVSFDFAPPSNDDFANAIPLGIGNLQGTLVGATNDGSNSVGDPAQPDVWYSFTAAGPGTLRVDTCDTASLSAVDTTLSLHPAGAVGTAANELAANDDWGSFGGDPGANCPDVRASSLLYNVPSAQTVLIRVARAFNPSGEFALNLIFDLAPPPNDDFANAIPLGIGNLQGTLVGATNDGSNSVGDPAQPDVWYSFTAAGPGTLRVDTCDTASLSAVDTTLSLHPSGAVGTAANELAANDDWGSFGGDLGANCPDVPASSLLYNVPSAQTVLIRVARAFNPSGEFALNLIFDLAPPPNDDFANAIQLMAPGTQGTLLAGSKDGSSSVDNVIFPNEPDVWYLFTAPADGTARIDTCGSVALSDIYTTLSLHPSTGAPGTSANELAANDRWQGPGGDPTANCSAAQDSSLAYLMAAGETVLVRVSREDDIGNEFLINVSFELASVDTDGDGVTDDLDNCTLEPNASQLDTNGDGFGNACDGDFNGDCSVNLFDLIAFKAAFGTAGPSDSDFNGDNNVNLFDLIRFKALFGQPVGPSALASCP